VSRSVSEESDRGERRLRDTALGFLLAPATVLVAPTALQHQFLALTIGKVYTHIMLCSKALVATVCRWFRRDQVSQLSRQ
jgi:hypothetical protein